MSISIPSYNESYEIPFYDDVYEIIYDGTGCSAEDLLQPGCLINSIRLGNSLNDEYYSKRETDLILDNIFTNTWWKIYDKKVAFECLEEKIFTFNPPKSSDEAVAKHYVVVSPYEELIDGQESYYLKRMPEIVDALFSLGKPADFGDLSQQMTRIDEKVRRGKQIAFDEIDPEIICIDPNITKDLENVFSEKMGFRNITVKPYKINLYEKGDFFSKHTDSPEKNLLATIIVNLYGEVSSMIIDGKEWESKNRDSDWYHQNTCMFWTDVEHEVTPVKSRRISVSFKVFVNRQDDMDIIKIARTKPSENPVLSKILFDKFSDETNFGVLLNSGYAYINDLLRLTNEGGIDDIRDFLKGSDLPLFDALLANFEKSHEWFFVPVITKVRQVDRNDNYHPRYDSSDSDDDLNDQSSDNDGEFKFGKFDYDCEGSAGANFRRDGSYSCNDSVLDVYQISELFAQKLIETNPETKKNLRLDISEGPPLKIYTINALGSVGHFIGSRKRKNQYIGNSYSGFLVDNLYVDLMIVFRKK